MYRYKDVLPHLNILYCGVLSVCSDNFANYVFIWQGYYFTYHITSKLIIEKMSRYMRWKKIEENPPANKCIKNKIIINPPK